MIGLDFERLNPAEISLLEGTFTEGEVFLALGEFNGDKAPGFDRFSMAFWQNFWDFVKVEVMSFFKDFYDHGCFVR